MNEGLDTRTVVLVEDDADTRESFCALLHDAGFRTIPVGSGAELLLALRQLPTPEAIVMDLGLPDAEGVSLCRIVRAHWRFEGVPIIAVTGWSTGRYVAGLREAPFNEVLQKPVDIHALIDTIKRWTSI